MQEAYQQINERGTFSEYKLRMIQILTEKLNFNRWRGNSPMLASHKEKIGASLSSSNVETLVAL